MLAIKKNEPLSRHTSFGVGGPARYYIEADSIDSLKEIFSYCKDRKTEWMIIGAGTNILVSDAGYDGCIIRLTADFDAIRFEPDGPRAGAGAGLALLIATSAERGFAGLEGLAGIPGTVGGALAMNAGGKYGCIGDFVSSVCCLSEEKGAFRLSREQIQFGYRRSSLERHVVVSADFALKKDDPETIKEKMRRIILEKSQHQPLGQMSAGCIFKNPPGRRAGELIEEAGLKGARVGGAYVSQRHANFIINNGNASADDIFGLIHLIQEKVGARFGIDLELEVKVIGAEGSGA